MGRIRRHSPVGRPRGFTLIEVLIAVAILGFTMLAIGLVIRTGTRSWTLGHGLSELTQSARLAQDIVLRDLSNVMFISENDYNQSFRNQLDAFAQMYAPGEMFEYGTPMSDLEQRRRERDRRSDRDDAEQNPENIFNPMGSLSLEDIPPPVDLSFVGSNGGDTDRLSLARRYVPRWIDRPEHWALRRIEYFVQDGTLYRTEEDAFGYRPGEVASKHFGMMSAQAETGYNPSGAVMSDLVSLFSRGAQREMKKRDGTALIPSPVSVTEPLCDNVEVFNITYGFFEGNEWHEVNDWDSGATRYRAPPELDEEEYALMIGDLGSQQLALLGQMNAFSPGRTQEPDNLPAYIAVQIGLRLGSGKGRIYSFTFYHSFPQAQETDTRIVLPDVGEIRREYGERSSRRRTREGREL